MFTTNSRDDCMITSVPQQYVNNNKCPSSFHDAHSHVEKITRQKTIRHAINHRPGGGGNSHAKGAGMVAGNFELNP